MEPSDEDPLVLEACDPSGVRFDGQAVPVYSRFGPTMIGTSRGPGGGPFGVLSLVNLLLASVQGPGRDHVSFGVFVHDVSGDIVAESDHPTMADAHAAARAFADRIERGQLNA